MKIDKFDEDQAYAIITEGTEKEQREYKEAVVNVINTTEQCCTLYGIAVIKEKKYFMDIINDAVAAYCAKDIKDGMNLNDRPESLAPIYKILTKYEREEFRKLGLWPVAVPGDGTCQYHACGLFLTTCMGKKWYDGSVITGKPMSGHVLRQLVAEYSQRFINMAESTDGTTHAESVRAILGRPDDPMHHNYAEDGKRYDTVEEYINGIKNGEYGDEFTLKVISNMFFLSIRVLNISSAGSRSWSFPIEPSPLTIAEAKKSYRRDIEIREVKMVKCGDHYWALIHLISPFYYIYSRLNFSSKTSFGTPGVIDWRDASILFFVQVFLLHFYILSQEGPPLPPSSPFSIPLFFHFLGGMRLC